MSSEQAVARLIESLERDGVPYMLVGALSSNLYGVPRATNDADLVIRFDSFNLIEFCDRLGDDPHHVERFARRRRLHVPECSAEAWVAAPEDVVIQKLRWARRKDLDDVVNLLAVSREHLDWDYLRR